MRYHDNVDDIIVACANTRSLFVFLTDDGYVGAIGAKRADRLARKLGANNTEAISTFKVDGYEIPVFVIFDGTTVKI